MVLIDEKLLSEKSEREERVVGLKQVMKMTMDFLFVLRMTDLESKKSTGKISDRWCAHSSGAERGTVVSNLLIASVVHHFPDSAFPSNR